MREIRREGKYGRESHSWPFPQHQGRCDLSFIPLQTKSSEEGSDEWVAGIASDSAVQRFGGEFLWFPLILPSSSSGFSSQRQAQSRLVILFSIRRRRGNLFLWVVLLKQRRALITAHSTFLSRCCLHPRCGGLQEPRCQGKQPAL